MSLLAPQTYIAPSFHVSLFQHSETLHFFPPYSAVGCFVWVSHPLSLCTAPNGRFPSRRRRFPWCRELIFLYYLDKLQVQTVYIVYEVTPNAARSQVMEKMQTILNLVHCLWQLSPSYVTRSMTAQGGSPCIYSVIFSVLDTRNANISKTIH